MFFGVGIILLTYIQQQGAGSQSGLDSFLFGQAASLVRQDIILIAGISAVLLLLCIVFFKEFTLITFDLAFAKGLGIPVRFLNGLLACLIVCAVVIGLQTVGVILMAAMLITPAITARYWTERLTGMIIIAGITGGVSGVAGTLLSTTMKGMATGPLMILSATLLFLFSMICAPKRGLAAKAIRLMRLRRRTSREQVLLAIYEQYEKNNLCVTVESVRKKRRLSPSLCLKALNDLEQERCIERIENGIWQITSKGIEKGYHTALKQRMYEVYLMHEMELANIESDQDYFDPDRLPRETRERLYSLLKLYGRMPERRKASHDAEKGQIANEF